jgi:hypothetical protein
MAFVERDNGFGCTVHIDDKADICMTMDTDNPDDVLKVLTEELSTLEETDKRDQLATYINFLMLNDFNGLIYLLYRVDVDEKNLRSILDEQKGQDASLIIADLVLLRMKEKEKSRQSFRTNDEISEEDKW